MSRVLTCTVHLTGCSYHVTYAFQSESTISSCLNVKELLAQNKHDIWSLSDSIGDSVRDMMITYSQMSHTDKDSQRSSIIGPVLLNGWVFVYELIGCGSESHCCHSDFIYCACFLTFRKVYGVDSLWNA